MPEHCAEHNRLAVDTQVALQSIQRDLVPIKCALEALTLLAKESSTNDLGREKLNAEYNHQLIEDLKGIQATVDDIFDSVTELSRAAKTWEAIEENSGVSNRITEENNSLLKRLTGIREDKPTLPTIETIAEICRNSRIAAGKHPDTGRDVEGFDKIIGVIKSAFWQWVGILILFMVYLLLKPYIPGWLSGLK